MIVVGVGCGPGFLTQYAIDCIRGAKSIYGSERAIQLAKGHIADGCEVTVIKDYSCASKYSDDTVLLSTGDPMLAGLGHYGTEVVPGISSMQLAFARLRLPLVKAVVVNAHGRDHDGAIEEATGEVVRGKTPFILVDPEFDLLALGSALMVASPGCKIVTLENLGYPTEVISFGSPDNPPRPSSRLFSVIIVKDVITSLK
jgi:cobalt-precorrin-7 (C5)-methyltransferase